jgi:hypothetical protein
MRARLAVSLFVLGIGCIWIVLAVFTAFGPYWFWGIGLALIASGALGVTHCCNRFPQAAEDRRHLEMIEAVREGLYK